MASEQASSQCTKELPFICDEDEAEDADNGEQRHISTTFELWPTRISVGVLDTVDAADNKELSRIAVAKFDEIFLSQAKNKRFSSGGGESRSTQANHLLFYWQQSKFTAQKHYHVPGAPGSTRSSWWPALHGSKPYSRMVSGE